MPMDRHSKSTLGVQAPRVQITRDHRRKADPGLPTVVDVNGGCGASIKISAHLDKSIYWD
jgi:hypothetical protein